MNKGRRAKAEESRNKREGSREKRRDSRSSPKKKLASFETAKGESICRRTERRSKEITGQRNSQDQLEEITGQRKSQELGSTKEFQVLGASPTGARQVFSPRVTSALKQFWRLKIN